MLTQDFCYFLQGFSEIANKPPTPVQWEIIKTKLNSVFEKVTPDRLIVEPMGWGGGVVCGQPVPILGTTFCAGESPLVKPTYCSSMPGSELTHIIGPSSCHPVLPFKIEACPPVLKSVDRTC